MKIVEVLWYDAACESATVSLSDAEKINPLKRTSVGYLILENKEKVIISFGMIFDKEHNADSYQDTLVVPRGDVKEIKELK